MTTVDVMFQSRATLVTVTVTEKTQKTRFLLILSTSDNSLGSKYEASEIISYGGTAAQCPLLEISKGN